ncbi:MAG TPA: adenosylcobinamide-GDP ribazoletransferase [Smithellaceae bacterium]|nr:adenosylcobinamide-GDP ribazoletransferase [Smithellaceae bacterium]HRV44407.1 adenosylcobinamide-GDP ribazoletransferase [Smithellaceae bacterium]
MRNLRTAFGLLTTLPVGMPRDWQPGDSGRAAFWYPVVGLTAGGLVWLVWLGLNLIFPPPVASVLALAVWVGLTGGLHLDGLADCCDALPSSVPLERRLEILKDPHLGTFGGVGLIVVLLAKAAALAALPPAFGLGIVLAATVSRWLILPAALLPQARPDGMGVDFALGLRRSAIILSAVLPLGIAFAMGARGWIALAAALAAAAALLALSCARIRGVTGDVFGLLVEVTETVILLSLAGGRG